MKRKSYTIFGKKVYYAYFKGRPVRNLIWRYDDTINIRTGAYERFQKSWPEINGEPVTHEQAERVANIINRNLRRAGL